MSSPQPPSDGGLTCQSVFYAKLMHEEGDPLPAILAGAITPCVGFRGHTGEHVGSLMDNRFYAIWAPFPNADGITAWSIQDSKGNQA